MSKREHIEEAVTIYWERIRRRKEDSAVVHQQPNKKLSTVEIVGGVPVVTLKNVRGFLAKIKLTPRVRKRVTALLVNDKCAEAQDHFQHKQVKVKVGDFEADVDEELAPLIGELWKAGIETVLSCQENRPGIAWIAFMTISDLTSFLNIVGYYEPTEEDSLYRRITWTANEVDGWWEYDIQPEDLALLEKADGIDEWHEGQADFHFAPSVRFPRTDLPTLLQRMMQHNDDDNFMRETESLG